MPKSKFYKILSVVFKNLLAFLTGGFLGVAATLLCMEPLLKATIKKDVGLGIIAVAPAFILIYSIIFGIAGGILAILIYNLAGFWRKKRAAKKP